jgi:peptidoglycan hydrolase CwlO-like protein
MKSLRKLFFLNLFFLSAFFLSILFVADVFGQTCGNVDECQKLIGEYQSQVTKLQSQANTLSNQIAQFNAQITLTSLKIKQTEEKITLLGGRIDQLEVSLDDLTKAFASRAVETYKLARNGSTMFLLLTSVNLNEVVSRFHYLQVVQKEDGNFLQRLQTAQVTYKSQKTDQEELQKELEKEKSTLNAQKIAKANLLSATKNDEAKYQSLLSSARAQLSAFRSYVTRQGGASILSNQTKCDGWGCYYNQRDSLWGNISLGGSPYNVAEYGCLVTSVSMIASHYGKSIKPNDIAVNASAFVPGTGYLYHTFSAGGVNVTLTAVSKSGLDGELSSGKPVIAGLYGGPDHFIVILKKEGDSYIMHDPFLENGSNRKLTDKYNVSDITTLRLVQFN